MLGLRGVAAVLTVSVTVGCSSLGLPSAVAPTPAVAPVAQPAPAPPPLALKPRSAWRQIPMGPRSGNRTAYVASDVASQPDGTRRVWIVMNLAAPIRLPETGGSARSVAFLADFRCDPHAWDPIEAIWFAQRDAVTEAVREQPRGPSGIRDVTQGTFVDVFVRAACRAPAARPAPATRARRT